MHSDDIVTLCQHLMEYYKSEEKKRAERVELLKEKNRQKSIERYMEYTFCPCFLSCLRIRKAKMFY